MDKVKFFLILFVSLFLVNSSFAESATGKIGFVNLSRIFDEYTKTKEYDALLEKKHSTFQEEHKEKLQNIKDAESKLSLMKESEKNKLQSQIEKDKNDLLAFDRQRQTDLKKERDEKVRDILSEIEKVVKDYASKENYSLILNDRVLIFGGDNLDITNQILKLLNEKYSPSKN